MLAQLVTYTTKVNEERGGGWGSGLALGTSWGVEREWESCRVV